MLQETTRYSPVELGLEKHTLVVADCEPKVDINLQDN